MKRVKESGAYYRNKKKAKEEIIKRNEGALLKFVKVSETTECTPALPESTPGPSGSILKTSDVRNQEVDQIGQDTNDSQLLIKINDLSDSNSSVVTAEIPQQNMTDFDSNDIGKWPESINSNLRLLLIQRGPEGIQHMDTNFSEETTVSRTSTTQSDAGSTKSKVVSRRLSNDWFLSHIAKRRKSFTLLDGVLYFKSFIVLLLLSSI